MKFPCIALAVSVQYPSTRYLHIIEQLFDLLTSHPKVENVLVEQSTVDSMLAHKLHFLHSKLTIIAAIADHLVAIDLIIVVGGDGSMLRIGRITIGTDVPIIGINQGKLGFLADLHAAIFAASLLEILDGEYLLEKRPVLQLSHLDENNKQITSRLENEQQGDTIYAMNELLVQGNAEMILFEVSIGNQHTFQQRGDGIMIATPTGSTGHCLSAGGPIVAPDVSAICLVPVCPHNLSSRPVIINASSQIEVTLLSTDRAAFWCADGIKLEQPMLRGHSIVTSLLPSALRLLHTSRYSFLASCAEKLGWERL